jgi:PEP-CTERM motif
MQEKQFIRAIGLAVAGFVAALGGANAQVTVADVGVNPTFEQTGPTTVTSTGGFFSGRAFVTNASDFAGGTLSYGGPGSPQNLSYIPADVAWEFGDSNGTFSNLQTADPTGGYVFDLTGGTMGPAFFSFNYDGDGYANTPQLAAASFSALQDLNAAAPITLDFNPMDVSPNATPGANNIFFSIVNTSDNMAVFSSPALPTTATSVTIPGGRLLPGQSYTFDLLFDDRITGTDPDSGVFVTQFYDTHTFGSFSTAAGAVPEPTTWAMMLIGFAGLGFAGYRASRKGASAVAKALVRTGLTQHNLPADCSNDRGDECSTWTNSSKAAISIAK